MTNGPGVTGPAGWLAARRLQHHLRPAAVACGLVAVVMVAFLVVSLMGGHGGQTGGKGSSQAAAPAKGTYRLSAAALSELHNVPASMLLKNAEAANVSQVTAPEVLPSSAPSVTSNGRPEIIYIGTPFCAACAGERWALVLALSKFGTFANLSGTTSADIHPGGPTFSFSGATYTSRYLSFVTDEQTPLSAKYSGGVDAGSLTLSEQEYQIMTSWDVTPYATQSDAVPFLYIGGKFLLSGFQYDSSKIWRMSFQAATKLITSGSTAVSKNMQAAAGFLVADFCALSNGQPASICSQVPSSVLSR